MTIGAIESSIENTQTGYVTLFRFTFFSLESANRFFILELLFMDQIIRTILDSTEVQEIPMETWMNS